MVKEDSFYKFKLFFDEVAKQDKKLGEKEKKIISIKLKTILGSKEFQENSKIYKSQFYSKLANISSELIMNNEIFSTYDDLSGQLIKAYNQLKIDFPEEFDRINRAA